jgi:prepilin signal peptidase PulO-like enzyme (type II secretory pathway)
MIELLFIIFGLIVGSFINALAYRLANGLPWVNERSHCVSCKQEIKAWDLVPVLSFLVLRGRCRHCGEKISLQYPIVELLTAVSFFLVGQINGFLFSWTLVYQLIFVSAFVFIALYDYQNFLILDVVIFPLIIFAVIWNLGLDIFSQNTIISWHSQFVDGLKGALVAGGFFALQFAISKGRWIGFGDVKYGLALGLFFGFHLTLVCLFLAYILGSLVGGVLLAQAKKRMDSKIAFGTFLSLSAIITVGYGQQLLAWYLGILGI